MFHLYIKPASRKELYQTINLFDGQSVATQISFDRELGKLQTVTSYQLMSQDSFLDIFHRTKQEESQSHYLCRTALGRKNWKRL